MLWERGSAVSDLIARTRPAAPAVDAQWIEDRFGVWVHYVATKLGRGELFEVIEFLSFLRSQVLGPLYQAQHGASPRGVRRVEQWAPEFAATLRRTLAGHDSRQCVDAVRAAVELYRTLRDRAGGDRLVRRTAAEQASLRCLAEVVGALPAA